MPIDLNLKVTATTSNRRPVGIPNLPQRELEEVWQEWGPRFSVLATKRFGSVLRGRTPVSVRRKTGVLARGVQTTGRAESGFKGKGRIGRIAVASAGANANAGTFPFVQSATRRAIRSRKFHATLNLIASNVLRKILRERASI